MNKDKYLCFLQSGLEVWVKAKAIIELAQAISLKQTVIEIKMQRKSYLACLKINTGKACKTMV